MRRGRTGQRHHTCVPGLTDRPRRANRGSFFRRNYFENALQIMRAFDFIADKCAKGNCMPISVNHFPLSAG